MKSSAISNLCPATATCDKAGQPNDVCPCGQVMSASPNDAAFGCDVVPSAQWANITSLATIGSNITVACNNITLTRSAYHFQFDTAFVSTNAVLFKKRGQRM